jgi:AhpD family alkylhydroperoxidase
MSNMQNWNAYRDVLIERIGDFATLSPDVTRGLHTIESSASKTKHLDPKIHEIIALAVAVTTRCDGCIAVHAKKAVELGATREEIAEALGTEITVTVHSIDNPPAATAD